MTAFGAKNPRESVVRIAAFDEALDNALFKQALQPPFGSQFRQVAIGASVERARAGVARAIHTAFRHPARRSPTWIAAN